MGGVPAGGGEVLTSGSMLFSSDADFTSVCSGQDPAEPKGKALGTVVVTERMRSRIQAVKDEEGEEEIWLLCSGSCQMDGWISVVCSYSSEEASVNAGVCVGSLM